MKSKGEDPVRKFAAKDGCSYCSGTGEQKCPKCHAVHGFVDDCEFCKGKGNISCLVCLGEGADRGYSAKPMWS